MKWTRTSPDLYRSAEPTGYAIAYVHRPERTFGIFKALRSVPAPEVWIGGGFETLDRAKRACEDNEKAIEADFPRPMSHAPSRQELEHGYREADADE